MILKKGRRFRSKIFEKTRDPFQNTNAGLWNRATSSVSSVKTKDKANVEKGSHAQPVDPCITA